jgi:hypothetical protein
LIKGIESFPPVIYPGAEAVLKADLSLPENTDPFLSWTQNNSLIKSGMYSEGLAEINWTAPMAEGVYSIALDVFPIAPVNGSYSFQSQTRMSTEVYVTSTSDISSENDLGPDESYYVLFHFNGNLENSGTGFESLKAEADKELKIIQVNETLGYEMDGISAITIPEFILPLKQNKLQPFTIELGVTFEDIEVNGKILSVKTENNDFYLEIFINNNSVPEVQITSDSTSSSIPSGIEEIAINERYMLNLSVIPAGIGLDVIWFLDGQTYSSGHINNSPSFISDTGSAEIKFKGIIDEFGVYFNSNTSSADPYIFYNAMKLIYKSNVLFADGFDSNELQNQFELTGSASFEAGVLKLKSGQNLTLPEVFIPRPGNINSINILLDSPAGFTYRYNNSLLEIIVSDNELIDKISSVDFTINDNAITISNEAFSVTDEESIIIKIINSTESSIFIDSLLAYTE